MTATLRRITEVLDEMVTTAPGDGEGGGELDIDIDIDDVEHDSRAVRPASLFACVNGERADGHDHAPDAIAAGATALLVERPLHLGVPEIVVADVRRAMGPAASTVHHDPSRSLAVVGVTGTNGKTTTVTMVAGILSELGLECTEIGTLTGSRTTPEAPELQRQLAAARDRADDVVAMEVSSHALDQHRVDGTRFRVVAFTNLGADHLDHHGTMEDYFLAKASLFRPELADSAVIDARTPEGRRLAQSCVIPVVAVGDDDVRVLELAASSSRFLWRGETIELPLGGEFNVSNAVIAAEIVVALGQEPSVVAAALAHAPAVPGRFETIDEGQDFVVIVDYAHTPEGLEAVLTAARGVATRSLVVVFGAGGERDHEKRPRMGEVARRLADRVVVTNDNPRGEDPEAIIAAIVTGMERPPDLVEADRRVAIRHAFAGARAGDVVLLAGKGHEDTQTIGAEVLPFDDRAVAREELRRFVGRDS